jgi:hypothetical protein
VRSVEATGWLVLKRGEILRIQLHRQFTAITLGVVIQAVLLLLMSEFGLLARPLTAAVICALLMSEVAFVARYERKSPSDNPIVVDRS